MNQLLQALMDNLRSVREEFGLTEQERPAIRKSLVEEYLETVKEKGP